MACTERRPLRPIAVRYASWCLREGFYAELPIQQAYQPAVLAHDLIPGPGATEHLDERGMRLLAQRVARDQPKRCRSGADEVPVPKAVAGKSRERVLEQVGEVLTVSCEALEVQVLNEVAAIERDGTRDIRGPSGEKPLESGDVEVALEVAPQAEPIGVTHEHVARPGAGLDERQSQAPQRLSQSSGCPRAGLGPEVAGNRLAQPRTLLHCKCSEQGLFGRCPKRDAAAQPGR